jgi:glycopeptide antibiotics resistance protein
MLGLALLSATHWARGAIRTPGSALGFALGVLPNFAAGFAMPLILASLLPAASGTPVPRSARRRFLFLLAFTTLGLVAWEVIQSRSDRFVFDLNDIAATLLGAMLAYAGYAWLSKSAPDASRP